MKNFFFLALLIAGLLMLTGHAAQAASPNARSEERWKLHLNVIKVSFDDVDEPQSRICLGISHKINPKVISRYAENKSQMGTYVRTQYNVLICEAKPCAQIWSAGFVYTDETGKSDTFGLTWKQIVFDGITPDGTVKRELLYCLNGRCENLENPLKNVSGNPLEADFGRYHLEWSNHSLVIRRTDIAEEILKSGRSVETY